MQSTAVAIAFAASEILAALAPLVYFPNIFLSLEAQNRNVNQPNNQSSQPDTDK